MHENPLICRLLKITPRASSVVETDNGKDTASDNVTEATPSEGGLKLGKISSITQSSIIFTFQIRIRFPRVDCGRGFCRLLSGHQKPRTT